MSSRASLQWIVCDNVNDAMNFKNEFNLSAKCVSPDNTDHVMDDSSVNAVMIVSPTATHESLINKSLMADKDVFCEKPLTPSVETTRKCYEIAESKNRTLLCGFSRRFDPSFYSVYKKVRSGSIGPVRIVKSTSRDYPFPPIDYLRTSGGIFKDSTVHDLDMCSWLAGSKPISVYAQGHANNLALRDFGDNDQVVVVVTYENGTIGVVDNGRWAPFGYDQRLEVLCEKEQLNVANKSETHVMTSSDEGTVLSRSVNDFIERYPVAYRNELDHFINIIQGKEEPRVSKMDTIRAMRLVELCYTSLEKQSVVEYTE
ncbi:hypothetical protein ACF0H5_024320 [Mactra antiquata]